MQRGFGSCRNAFSFFPMRVSWLLAAVALLVFAGPVRAETGAALQLLAINKPPLSYYEGNRMTGLATEIVSEILARTGLDGTVSMESFGQGYTRVLREPATALFPLSRTTSREGAFKWVGPLLHETVSLYALRDSGVEPASLDAARRVGSIAVMDGYASQEYLQDLGFTNLFPHRSPAQCADSLRYGRVDLWLTSEQTMASLARQADVDPDAFRKVLEVTRFPAYIAFSRATPDGVVEAWQTALEELRIDGTLDRLRAKWLPRISAGVRAGIQLPTLRFTADELRFIESHGTLRVGVVGSAPPFDVFGPDGGHQGINADYLRLVEKRTGLKFAIVMKPWRDILNAARTGGVDLIVGVSPTPEAEQHLLFTSPFLNTPSVIVARQEAPFLAGLRDLKGGTVAVVRDSAIHERLRREHAILRLAPQPTVRDALTEVSLGRADAYVGDLISASYCIRSFGLTNLRVAARTDYGVETFSIAVPKGMHLLRNVLDKTLDSITQVERDAVYDAWLTLPFGGGKPLDLVWTWAGRVALVLVVVLALALFWLRGLRREVKEQAGADARLAESERRFRDLFNNVQAGIALLRTGDGGVVAANQRMAELLDCATAELVEPGGRAAILFEELKRARVAGAGEGEGRVHVCASLPRRDGSLIRLDCQGLFDAASDTVTIVALDVTERYEVEQALRASESMMRALVDAMPFYVAYLGADRRFRLLNSVASKALGVDAIEAQGKHVSEIVRPEAWALFKPLEDKALAGESVQGDMEMDSFRRGGHYSVMYSPHKDSRGRVQGLAVCAFDTTDKKRAESELRASEQRYRSVVERSNDAIVIVSLEGKLLFGNSRATALFGYTLQEARGMDVRRFFCPEDWERAKTLLLQPGEMTYEARMLDREGNELLVENSRAVISYEGQLASLVLVRDVSERKHAEALLRKSQERLEMAIQNTEFGLWEYMVETDVLELPGTLFGDLYGYDVASLPNSLVAWSEMVHPDDRQRVERAMRAFIQEGSDKLRTECRVLDTQGRWRWVAMHGRVQERGVQGLPVRLLGLMQDVTERKSAEQRLRELATIDGLTGLVNRRHFLEAASREMERARRYKTPLSLVMFDVDRFKGINDSHGHDVGDQVLRVLSEIGLKSIRTVDVLGRLGGEEFALLLPETGLKRACEVAERLRMSYGKSEVPGRGGAVIGFTASFGVAEAGPGETLDTFLRRADQAMYAAKENGRNRVETAPS